MNDGPITVTPASSTTDEFRDDTLETSMQADSCRITDQVDTQGPATDTSSSPRLADHTTFRVGGPARTFVRATTEAQIIETVSAADRDGVPVMVLSGGSNLLVADEGFPGTVVKIAWRGITAQVSDCGGAFVTVNAGESWDDLVAFAVAKQWIGVEALSGIPGLVGSTPIQNVGAYGTEVSQTIARVRTWDRQQNKVASFAASDCDFGYRTSRFKREPERYVVLQVSFQFELGDLSMPIRYPELARALGVDVGHRAPLTRVREAVLAIRRSKGMVVDPDDRDSWSAGSFFTNPLLSPEQAADLPEDAPRYPQLDGLVKTSAAWLIQHAGFDKGFGADLGSGRARLSSKHTLALTNHSDATAADVLTLARTVRDGVSQAFGVVLVPEPVLVGCSL
ncbi:UDP-N-acetylmuramate dehydrogenase [Aestuariimicrobium kwangyangense]|uniref:UDP-N-acetylmuramate dehydrogenase n=1 Tax=Aestuariimicrobium kwangyangense TaxID=396389 RepID=UPI0003B44B13|nr:UDP-N-acetylmuramate dehydrogenase [Aestuariimicrobium kwangyangense]